jgi:glycosyltransferase involved in cell wall biosynthesis
MFSVIIATHDSARALVPTLTALVAGATAGIVREVIIADGGSRDEIEQVADIAGCRFLSSGEPLGARLSAAAAIARGDWLIFLRPGGVPGMSWVDETFAFVQQANQARAAVFAPEINGIVARLSRALSPLPHPDQGLILPSSLYDEIGGHRANARDPESDLLRRIGRRRLALLRTTITISTV